MARWFYGVNAKKMSTNTEYYEEDLRHNTKFMSLIEESHQWRLYCLIIRRNSIFHEPLSKFILEYSQHGLFTYSESKWYPKSLGGDDPDEAQVLTMDMMAASFIVWLVCVIISIIVFFIEIAMKKFTNCNIKIES